MPSTYTTNLGIELPADGELDGVWGDVVNENMDILDRAINGSIALSLSGTSSTLTTSDGALSDGQYKLLVLGGTPSGTHTITIAPNDAQKIYFVRNTTAQSVVFTQGSGGNVTIATGDSAIIYSDGAGAGAAVVNITNDFAMSSVKITGGTIDGTVIGGSSAAAGTFTTAAATTGNITTVNATTVDTTNIEVTTLKAKDGTAAGSIADSTGVVTLASSVLTTADINGGTIDGTTIGGSSAGAGTFTTATATTGNITTVNATTVDTTNIEVTTIKAKDGTSAGSIADSTGVVTLASSVLTTTDINGGTVDGAVIGGSSAAAITGTTITATGDVTIADKIVHAGDTNTAIRFPAADTVTVETAGAERLRVDSSGNVGIGTSSPTARLDAVSSSSGATTEVLRLSNNGTGVNTKARLNFHAAGTNYGAITGGFGAAEPEMVFDLPSVSVGSFIWSSASTERMRIDASGNLGIGTSAPAARLHAQRSDDGDILIIRGTSNAQLIAGISSGNLYYDSSNGNAVHTFRTNGTERMRIDSSGNVGIGTTSMPAGRRLVVSGGNIRLDTDYQIEWGGSTVGLYGHGANNTLHFFTNTTERARITADGNVGIGTNSPFNDAGYTAIDIRGSTGGQINFGTTSTRYGQISSNATNGLVLNTVAAAPMLFFTQGNERARIDASGNVGIGGTPTGFGRFEVTQATNKRILTSTAAAYGGNALVGINDIGGEVAFGIAGSQLIFATGATERARIDASGELLVGTTDGNGRISLSGSGGNSAGGDLTLDSNASYSEIQSYNSKPLYINRQGNNTVLNSGGGDVLVGTTTNAGKLTVSGKIRTLGGDLELDTGQITTNSSANPLRLGVDGTERARIDSSGNLLVGATSVLAANRRLQVDGGALIACLFKNSASANEVFSVWNSATSGNNVFVQWETEAAGTARGTITYNRAGGLVAYNTTSDYRAKDIAGAIFGASDTVLNLKPYMGTMKGATIERPMFIAHETQEIAPYAVVGEKDAVDNDGNPIYQQMDHSALVPLLTAALQEALTEIASLKARLDAANL